jgi:hypothetical protein
MLAGKEEGEYLVRNSGDGQCYSLSVLYVGSGAAYQPFMEMIGAVYKDVIAHGR